MTIYCDLDGVLRTYLRDWKAFKYFMNHRQYMEKAKPIMENIEYVLSLDDVKIATCCRYQLLNEIWMEENGIYLPLIITGRNKVDDLAGMFDVRGSCLIDDTPSNIESAKAHGMHTLYVETNSRIPDFCRDYTLL